MPDTSVTEPAIKPAVGENVVKVATSSQTTDAATPARNDAVIVELGLFMSIPQLKMWQIMECLISMHPITVPITTPTKSNA